MAHLSFVFSLLIVNSVVVVFAAFVFVRQLRCYMITPSLRLVGNSCFSSPACCYSFLSAIPPTLVCPTLALKSQLRPMFGSFTSYSLLPLPRCFQLLLSLSSFLGSSSAANTLRVAHKLGKSLFLSHYLATLPLTNCWQTSVRRETRSTDDEDHNQVTDELTQPRQLSLPFELLARGSSEVAG